MAKLYITEYSQVGVDSVGRGQTAPQQPHLATQVVDFTAGAAASAAFNNDTRLVRIHTDAICSYKFGTAPTAATTDARMAAGQTEYHVVGTPSGGAGGLKVSAISNT